MKNSWKNSYARKKRNKKINKKRKKAIKYKKKQEIPSLEKCLKSHKNRSKSVVLFPKLK